MRIDLNLAADPFRNRTLFWFGAVLALLVSAMALMLVVVRAAHVGADTQMLRAKAATQQAAITDLQSRVEDIEDARAHAIFSSSDRKALDDARVLLNERSFSWSRLFNDLEPTVPASVKLSSISITDTQGSGADRVVQLAISGNGASFSQMAEFISKLDQTGGRFVADPVENGAAKDEGEYAFTVSVTYRPGVGAAPAGGKGDA